MIRADAEDVARVTRFLRSSSQGPVLAIAFMPTACFFVVEAYDSLRRHGLDSDVFLEENANQVRAARASLKLLDAEGFSGARDRLTSIEQASVQMFNSGHTGLLSKTKRALQDDLGLFFMGTDLVCTTHVGYLNAGIAADELAQASDQTLSAIETEVHTFAEGLGRFIGGLIPGTEETTSPELPPRTAVISAEDHEAAVVYKRISERLQIDEAVSAIFTWLTCHVNYVHRGLRKILPPDSSLLFRIQFLTEFHLLKALRMIGSLQRGDRTSTLGATVAELQSRSGARRLRKLDDLRNHLAHYDARPIAGEKGNPLDLLVVRLAGMTRNDLGVIVQEELEAASLAFRQVISKGRFGRREVRI